MDWILTQQFEKVLMEYRLLDEVRNCIDGILTQLELKEKDSIIKGLEKQIRQMKQENMVLEEANARYSKLQLIEAQQCYNLQQQFQKELGMIQADLGRTYALEKEVDASKAKIADLEQTNEKTLSEVKAKEEAMKDLQKELRTIRYAYMNVIAPSFHSSPSSFDKLSLPVCMEIFSYLDSTSAENLGDVDDRLHRCFEDVKKGEKGITPSVDTLSIRLNETIAEQRSRLGDLLEEQRQLKEEKELLKKRIEEMEGQLEACSGELEKTRGELRSAYNQMASDKEVKYYLDENMTQLGEEVKEKEQMIAEMKRSFAEAMRQKEAVLTETRQRLLAAVKGK